ncbi:MAG: SCO family protein [Methylophaga sp.]|nr:SCO family protein [Methylophaga sp.]
MLKQIKNITLILVLSYFSSISAAELKPVEMPILSGVGGNFSAVDADGKDIEFNDYNGKVIVIAFGYTNCADICPFTLGYLKSLYSKLSLEEQQRVRIIFVTIDPKYDTPGHLKSFIGHFNEDFIGLSGTQEQIDYIVSLYQAQYNKLSSVTVLTDYVRRVNPKEDTDKSEDKTSLYSHTVTLYLIDKDGFTRSLEYTGTPKDEFVTKIRVLIDE